MGRSGAVTFKGNKMTLAGNAVGTGQPAPDFTLHAFEDGGMNTIKPADLKVAIIHEDGPYGSGVASGNEASCGELGIQGVHVL